MFKRILVTGGSGFIGSNLCKKLLSENNEVICIDNCFSSKKENIYHLLSNPKFEFIRHDITIPILLEVDEIYNLACPASPPYYKKYPIQTIKTCVQGAINMLDLATKLNIKIFQASTSEIYGNPLIHPQPESYWGNVNPIGVRSCYDEGKRCAETLFFDYYRQYNTYIKIARIFNTYGIGMRSNDGRVVSNFINNAIINKPLIIYGDGTKTRSFCYVEDTVDCIIKLMATDNLITGPINIGSQIEISIIELAEIIIKLTKSKSKINFIKESEDDPSKRKPDNTKAKEILNWEPTYNLEEGLKKTIDFFKKI